MSTTAKAYRFLKRLSGGATRPEQDGLANDTSRLYGGSKQELRSPGSSRASGSEDPMAEAPDSFSSEAVHRAADERIRLEAIRQLETVNLDDEDPRIEPLPRFDSLGLFERVDTGGYSCSATNQDTDQDEEWDEVQGRFVPSDQDGCNRRST